MGFLNLGGLLCPFDIHDGPRYSYGKVSWEEQKKNQVPPHLTAQYHHQIHKSLAFPVWVHKCNNCGEIYVPIKEIEDAKRQRVQEKEKKEAEINPLPFIRIE